MKAFVRGLLVLALLAAAGAGYPTVVGPAYAQQSADATSAPPQGVACAYNSSLPSIASGAAGWLQCDQFGRLVTSGAGVQALSTTQTKVTIITTNAYQSGLAQNSARKGCTIQYKGATTGYVFFGASSPSDTTTGFQLSPGQTISCAVGGSGVATDQVWLTGTAGDLFTVASQ